MSVVIHHMLISLCIFEAYYWPRSRVQDLSTAAAVYQHQLSVPSLWGRLMSTSESCWGINGHATWFTMCGLAASAGVWLKANETSMLPYGPMRLRKDYFTVLYNLFSC